MGFRFRRRLRILPGVTLNLGKHGASSVSVGVRGLHTTLGRRNQTTVGLPGSGLSYTAYHGRRPGPGVVKCLAHLAIWGFLLFLLMRLGS